ncbi:hypothetical protein IFM89_012157, partial [Coptis chinensis]
MIRMLVRIITDNHEYHSYLNRFCHWFCYAFRDIRWGLTYAQRLCHDHKIVGVHGTIIELLSCDEKFFTAVEVTARNSLFHVVVDSDEISTR